MHEIAGKRMNRYHELGQFAFGTAHALMTTSCVPCLKLSRAFLTTLRCTTGPRLGLWIVVPFQLIVMVGLGQCLTS